MRTFRRVLIAFQNLTFYQLFGHYFLFRPCTIFRWWNFSGFISFSYQMYTPYSTKTGDVVTNKAATVSSKRARRRTQPVPPNPPQPLCDQTIFVFLTRFWFWKHIIYIFSLLTAAKSRWIKVSRSLVREFRQEGGGGGEEGEGRD